MKERINICTGFLSAKRCLALHGSRQQAAALVHHEGGLTWHPPPEKGEGEAQLCAYRSRVLRTSHRAGSTDDLPISLVRIPTTISLIARHNPRRQEGHILPDNPEHIFYNDCTEGQQTQWKLALKPHAMKWVAVLSRSTPCSP